MRSVMLVLLATTTACGLQAPAPARPGSTQAAGGPPPAEDVGLRLEKYAAPEQAFHVLSTLIAGPTESVLFDAQYKVSDGRRLADMIAATGTTLKAVVLSHADHDHYMGAMEIIERFPGTPVYMTDAGLADFEARSRNDLAMERSRGPDPEVPDSLVQPEALAGDTLFVDGQALVVIDGLVGDVRGPASAALWIPSLQTMLAGDLVFEGIHPWLGDADLASRAEWRRSLDRLKTFEPRVVVPGHKRDPTTPDSPDQIDFMLRYLDAYDAAMEGASGPDDVVNAMVEGYPDLALPVLMAYGARTWFKK